METDPPDARRQTASAGGQLLGPWGAACARLSRDVLIPTDLAFRVLHWPPEAEALLGWPPARALGFGLGTVLSLPPSVMGPLRERLLSQSALKSLTVPARRIGGARCQILLSAEPALDEQGLPLGYLFLMREQGAGAESDLDHRWLERLLEQIPLPVAVADAGGQMRFANPQARALFQLESGQPCCVGPCAQSAGGCRSEQALRGRVPSYWEINLNGQRVDMTAIPTALQGPTPDHVLYLGVPSQPHLSPELRKFFRAVDENLSGVLITNRAGLIEYSNPRTTEILGYSPLELINRDVHTLCQTPDVVVLNPAQPSLSQGAVESVLLARDGSAKPVRMAISDIRGEDGEVSNWVVMLDDVSERHAMEAREQHLREQVARSAQLAVVGEIATMIAHEINQPLNCIANFSQGLLRRLKNGGVASEALNDSLQEIMQQVGRAGDVVRNVRNLARRADIAMDQLQINDVVSEARACFDLLAKGSGVKVRVEGGENLLPVRMEKSQIEQVLVNLVKNAIEASREDAMGQAEVIIRTLVNARGGVRVEVEDHAALPSPETLARLGEPFFTTKSDGLGLGLSISRTLLENHGSHLEISPLSPRGKVFHFELEHSP